MKIISKFRDYYDPIAHTYGGGDPKIRYERLKIKNTGPFEFPSIAEPLSIRFNRELSNKYHSRLLIVGERVYSVFYASPVGLHADCFLPDTEHEIIVKGTTPAWKKESGKFYYKSPHAIELCKLVGQPVFWFIQRYDGKGKHFVEVVGENCWDKPIAPQLHKIKNFAKLYPADQIYQDLSYVLGNLMHTPPDDNPPVQVDEKVRFQKKGFGSKTSFRGK